MAGIVNTLLVQYATGYLTVDDAASVALYGRKEGFLKLGGVLSPDEATVAADAVLAFAAYPRETTTAGIEPVSGADQPYVGFGVADYVTAPDADGGTSSQRVMSITVAEDDNGEVTFAPELRNVALIREEQLNQQLKRLLNGGLRGITAAASPTPQPVTDGRNGLDQAWLKDELRARSESAWTGNRSGIGSTGGTFDPTTQQLLRKKFLFTGVIGATAGIVDITIPESGFPTGLLAVTATAAGGNATALVLIVEHTAAATTKTVIRMRVRDTADVDRPSGTQCNMFLDCEGW